MFCDLEGCDLKQTGDKEISRSQCAGRIFVGRKMVVKRCLQEESDGQGKGEALPPPALNAIPQYSHAIVW